MKKFLFWLQERIKSWITPAAPVLIIDLLSDLAHSRTELIVENVLLCQQLIILKRQIKRPPRNLFRNYWRWKSQGNESTQFSRHASILSSHL